MRGAYGKPLGTVARVNIGQVIMSVRGKDAHKNQFIEALRRAKMKFPGRQKVSHFSFVLSVLSGRNIGFEKRMDMRRWLVYTYHEIISENNICPPIVYTLLGWVDYI